MTHDRPAPAGQWNEASWLFQVIQGCADQAQLALQRNDPRAAREALGRIRRNATTAAALLPATAETTVSTGGQNLLQTHQEAV